MRTIEVFRFAVEDCIDRFVKTFLEMSYTFYTESDIHCYLYHMMLTDEELSKPVPNRSSHQVIIENTNLEIWSPLSLFLAQEDIF